MTSVITTTAVNICSKKSDKCKSIQYTDHIFSTLGGRLEGTACQSVVRHPVRRVERNLSDTSSTDRNAFSYWRVNLCARLKKKWLGYLLLWVFFIVCRPIAEGRSLAVDNWIGDVLAESVNVNVQLSGHFIYSVFCAVRRALSVVSRCKVNCRSLISLASLSLWLSSLLLSLMLAIRFHFSRS